MSVPFHLFRNRRLELFQRFSKHTHSSAVGCVLWNGPIKKRSKVTASKRARPEYGCISIKLRNGKRVDLAAHRVSYWLRYGDPGARLLRHLCGNSKCVKASHLFPGTHAENMRDRKHHACK